MKTCIVLPTYNEADNIKPLVRAILELHPDMNIIIVDDNSPDGTGAIVDRLLSGDNRISVIHRPKKMGLGSAYVDGFKQALSNGAELIFEMDADFSHDAQYLKDLLDTSKDADVVIGSRYVNGVRVEGWRFRRLILSKLANMYVSYLTALPFWDFTSGFRCYRRYVLDAIDLDTIQSDGYAFQIEMTDLAYKHGFRVMEIPITFKGRRNGRSKISRHVVWEAFWLTLKLHAPLITMINRLSYVFRDYAKYVESKNGNIT